MSAIVCAIRGGPDSQPTIAKSVDLAKETGLPLYFMYVVNLDFLTHTSSRRTHTLSEQMHQMGEFILLAAQLTAAADNVVVEGVIRQGQVREEIANLCHEVGATWLVIGQPKGQEESDLFAQEMLQKFIETGADIVVVGAPMRSPGRNIFSHDQIEAFIAELKEVANIEVILVEPGEEPRA